MYTCWHVCCEVCTGTGCEMFCISMSRHVSMSVHVCIQVFTYTSRTWACCVVAMHLNMYALAYVCLYMRVYMHMGCVHMTQRQEYGRIYPA